MRVLRLLVDEHHRIELHPALTVITGLTPDQRGTVRRALAAAATGLAPATGGLFEAQGVLLDLDQADLDLLDVADDPAAAVVAPASVPGAVTDEDAVRLGEAERDVIDRAVERRRAAVALAAARRRAPVAEDGTSLVPPPTALVAQARRADLLRRAIGLHRATEAEPVRAALDRRRDAARLTSVGAPAASGAPTEHELGVELRSALAGVGIDLRDLDLPGEEVVLIAEDWLDEHQRDVAWAVGASIELHGLEDSLGRSRSAELDAELATDPVLELARRRSAVEWAARAHADAIDRADVLRTTMRPIRTVPAKDLEWHLLARLAEHRRDRLAGAVPLVVDGVFEQIGDAELAPLLARVERMAGSVQIVLLGDDPRVEQWARGADERRVAVVAPTPRGTGGIWS